MLSLQSEPRNSVVRLLAMPAAHARRDALAVARPCEAPLGLRKVQLLLPTGKCQWGLDREVVALGRLVSGLAQLCRSGTALWITSELLNL